MDINEAYSILEIDSNISDQDLKNKFKTLAKIWHPDVNKQANCEEKFKQINSAYQTIQDYRKNPPQESFSFNDIFSRFGFSQQQGSRKQSRQVQHISLTQEISFRESVLGLEKEIEIDRDIKCEDCDGDGTIKKKNDCQLCDGFGRASVNQGNFRFESPCQCQGRGVIEEECQKCSRAGFLRGKSKLKVRIPPGIEDQNTIQLRGAGHYAGQSTFGDMYSNLLMGIRVKNDTELKLSGRDVVFSLKLLLLEALEGCSKSVPTINGNMDITIPTRSRHLEEVVLKNLGVGEAGNQRVILDVLYPEDQNKLIQVLKEGGCNVSNQLHE